MQTSSSLLLSTKVSAFRWECKRVLACYWVLKSVHLDGYANEF